MANHWIIVTGTENFARSRDLDWTEQGIKSRHRKKAEQMHAGDTITYYLTGVQAFAGVVEITSDYREERDRLIWVSKNPKKDAEDYPFRVDIRPVVILDAADWIPALDLVPHMEHPKRWPAAHWRLAFQGNVHKIGEADRQLLADAIMAHTPAGITRATEAAGNV